jgi:hypothetical protein
LVNRSARFGYDLLSHQRPAPLTRRGFMAGASAALASTTTLLSSGTAQAVPLWLVRTGSMAYQAAVSWLVPKVLDWTAQQFQDWWGEGSAQTVVPPRSFHETYSDYGVNRVLPASFSPRYQTMLAVNGAARMWSPTVGAQAFPNDLNLPELRGLWSLENSTGNLYTPTMARSAAYPFDVSSFQNECLKEYYRQGDPYWYGLAGAVPSYRRDFVLPRRGTDAHATGYGVRDQFNQDRLVLVV